MLFYKNNGIVFRVIGDGGCLKEAIKATSEDTGPMSEKEFGAIVRHDKFIGLMVLFSTEVGKTITEERFDALCGKYSFGTIHRIEDERGVRIEGHLLDDPGDCTGCIVSQWALAKLINEHFGFEVDVIYPNIK